MSDNFIAGPYELTLTKKHKNLATKITMCLQNDLIISRRFYDTNGGIINCEMSDKFDDMGEALGHLEDLIAV
jgi:hypothetical protein